MLRPASDLNGYQLLSGDGTVGELRDFYFDDQEWQVRYLVVDTGRWLSARRVLLAPEVVTQPEWDARRLPTTLTKEQVRRSPELPLDGPLTRSREEQLRDYYGWGAYWKKAGAVAGQSTPDEHRPPIATGHPEAVTGAMSPGAGADAELVAAARGAEEAAGEPQLRLLSDVKGYHVEATDGSVGHVAEVLLDDRTWQVRYLIVDTKNWLPGKHVVLRPQTVQQISWPESHVAVNLTREQVKAAPRYTPDALEELQAQETVRLRPTV